MKELIVMVHGFNARASQFNDFKTWFEECGYEARAIELSTACNSLKDCTAELEQKLENLFEDKKIQKESIKVHLIGHSMGGLIIKKYLNHNLIKGFLESNQGVKAKLGKVILIATPNQGSKMADIVCQYMKPLTKIYQPLLDLQTTDFQLEHPQMAEEIEIGVIAGNKSNIISGLLLEGENDGRVTVSSARVPSMQDMVVLPLGHKKIHRSPKTFQLVIHFLEKGSFTSEGKGLVDC
ncbi:serine aminopeptidase domain-containing protein [Natranaerobius thermophilus]|uniref:Serine aminopeptidase S33 domain-containing protein n=1 Tax=Natranaerobius thermophilus (strain ATCC BAA-1301 / DSM 18059 / JW/NM-WN-LF) TaxID=457570 RepID=B2A6T2_NATTJ|nr:alpha/beta hydrolase [Natranaerobius thermophilus]ACB84213.1 hypothetical protein Nther_0618 [Natranaerobius thermophilus JW/NM-WN-LF]